jgi:hypothetical protein
MWLYTYIVCLVKISEPDYKFRPSPKLENWPRPAFEQFPFQAEVYIYMSTLGSERERSPKRRLHNGELHYLKTHFTKVDQLKENEIGETQWYKKYLKNYSQKTWNYESAEDKVKILLKETVCVCVCVGGGGGYEVLWQSLFPCSKMSSSQEEAICDTVLTFQVFHRPLNLV